MRGIVHSYKHKTKHTPIKKRLIFISRWSKSNFVGVEGLTSLCSAAASHSQTPLLQRGIGYSADYRLLRYAFPFTSPVGPLQRTALRKKLINQLFFASPRLTAFLGEGLTSLCSATASHRSFFPSPRRWGPCKELHYTKS